MLGYHRYSKATNKYMKDYEKNKKSLYDNYVNVNNLYGCAMSQKVVLSGLKIHLSLTKILWKATMKILVQDIFLQLTFNFPENYMNFITIYTFCLKE